MKRFVDTSGWIATFDGRDRYHAVAAAALQATREQAHFVTSDYVLDETLTYLLNRAGKGVAVRCVEWALEAPFIDILHVDTNVWQEAWLMFRHYEDKSWSFTDCTSFVLMRQASINHTFAFDRHFEQAGFRLWPEQGA